MPRIPPRRVFLSAAFIWFLIGTAQAAPPVAQSPPWFASIRADLPPGLVDPASRRPWLEPQGLAPFPTAALGGPDSLDVHWRSGFGLPVPDRYISALLVNGDVLVAGGAFARIGDMDAPGLAAWDGTSWSRIGEFPGSYVQDLAPYPDGFVAIAGAYGATVWHWNGSIWETWSEPSGYYAMALAAEDTRVAVASVVYTGSTALSRVHLHTPSGWTALGGDFDKEVMALAWYGGSLYAAGMFEHVDGVDAARIARWDGVRWQPLAQQLPHDAYGGVRSLAVYRGELVAAGPFGYRLDPSEPRFFARWDGSRWAPLGTGGPESPNLTRLRVVGTDLYALGSYSSFSPNWHGIARWDGSIWHHDEDRLQTFVNDVAFFQGDLHAGGALSRNGPDAASALMRRHAGVWRTPVPGPGMQGLLGWNGPLVQALEVTDRGIVAAGRIDFAGAPGSWRRCQGVALWDGTEWSPLGFEGGAFVDPYDLVVHQGELHAIGSFSEYGSVAKLTDAGWKPVSGALLNSYRGISALGDLYVAGSVDASDAFHGIARWDGASWGPVGGGVTRGAFVSAMAQLGSELIVAGTFQEAGGVPCENIAAWNPRSGWHALGAGLIGTVSDLTVRDGVLYAAGSCGLSSGAGEPWGILRWRAGRWENVGSCPCPANRLGWYRGRLVADRSGGLAMLDPDGSWHRLGTGTNGAVLDMVESGPSLFVGGMFSRAGSTSSYGFAEWRDDSLPDLEDPPGPQVAPAITSSPNPSSGPVHLRYALPVASHARVEVFDITGHRVDIVFDGQQSAGEQDVVWLPDAARVRAGVYFGRVTVGTSDRVVRMLRIP